MRVPAPWPSALPSQSSGPPPRRRREKRRARLRAGGIAVEEGLLATEAKEVAARFFSRITCHRPSLTLKLASTLDGRIATRSGASRWITGSEARRAAHAAIPSKSACMTS